MKSVLASVASAALLAGSVVAQSPPMVNTPSSSTVCQPLLITWTGGTPPYFLSILPGNQPSAAPLVDFGQVSGNQMSWTVNVTNSELGINLRDSTGQLSQSAAFPNLPGTNQACLTQAPSPPPGPTSGGSGSGSTSAPAPPTSAPGPSSPPAPPTTAVSTPATSKSLTSAASTNTAPTGSPSPSPSGGAASSLSAKAGIAGALGMAIAALFA